MDISICLCTFRRPALLDALLAELAKQDRAGLSCELIVVDNDPGRSGGPVVARWTELMPIPLRLLEVPEPNIALARNAAVHAATGEFVVFIDDDETPAPGWLAHMVGTQRDKNADAVIGPVAGRLPPRTPEWIEKGRFFAPSSFPTGTRLRFTQAYSGNCLLRRSMLMQIDGPFDAAFGVTGGSDTMLFWDAERRGAAIVWCEEAMVSEDVPAQRATLNWILRRAYRGGQSFVRSEISRLKGRKRLQRAAWLGLRACVQLCIAALLALLFVFVSRVHAIRWLRTACAQIGKLGVLAGHHYREYAQ